MGNLTAWMIGVGAFIVATLLGWAMNDLYAVLPIVERKLIGLAVRRLPEHKRETMGEEWKSELAHMPEDAKLFRLMYACGLVWGATVIGLRETRALLIKPSNSTSNEDRSTAKTDRALELVVSLIILALVLRYAIGDPAFAEIWNRLVDHH